MTRQSPQQSEQKFVINQDGTVHIEWIHPEFSDTIIELLPEKEKNMYKKIQEETGIEPRIYCG